MDKSNAFLNEPSKALLKHSLEGKLEQRVKVVIPLIQGVAVYGGASSSKAVGSKRRRAVRQGCFAERDPTTK